MNCQIVLILVKNILRRLSMKKEKIHVLFYAVLLVLFAVILSCSNNRTPAAAPVFTPTPDPSPVADVTMPGSVVKMIFIHHSTGSDWIASGIGNLGTALNANNYYVTESDYGWTAGAVASSCGGTDIGNRTDIADWPCWFTDETMPYVYSNTSHFDYPTNTLTDPGGDCQIVMFKSCFPNSEVGSSIDDEKAIYNSLLAYFAAHQDKMFVLVVSPPEIVIDSAPLTRQLANWLSDRNTGWLSAYGHNNVYAFDYYNVLTHPDNHHRIGADNREEHIVSNAQNTLYYYSGTNDHPTAAGHQKATAEYLPLLNSWYHLWKGL
jgi:hypothetical protein